MLLNIVTNQKSSSFDLIKHIPEMKTTQCEVGLQVNLKCFPCYSVNETTNNIEFALIMINSHSNINEMNKSQKV